MASIWKVSTPSGLNIRTAPGVENDKVRAAYPNGTQVIAENGEERDGWVHITSPTDGWMCKSYLTCLQEHKVEKQTEIINETNATPEIIKNATETMLNTGYNEYTVGQTQSAWNTEYLTFMKAFGSPPRFTDIADPPLYQSGDPLYSSCGRTYAETILKCPQKLSICPGKVKYLPNFTDKERTTFYETVQSYLDDAAKSRMDEGNKLSGKLYEFEAAYSDYICVVNCLCRMCAIMYGLGDYCMPGTNVKLKNFDYAWFTTATGNKNMQQDSRSIFGKAIEEGKHMLSTAVNDEHYIHFFVTGQGTSATDDFQTSSETSFLESVFSQSSLDNAARNLQFLTGNVIEDSAMMQDIESIFNGASSSWIKSFGSLATNYYKGGRLVFPQMLGDCSYGKSVSCTLTFTTIYGNKLSRFLRCLVPICHLLAFQLPQQIADNMYSYPFLVRAHNPGVFSSDLAFMSNMSIRGVSNDGAGSNVDGVPTSYEVTFDITPLYNQMMSSSTNHPWMAVNNTSLIEYLGNMCGVDMKLNSLESKIKMALNMAHNKTLDIPTTVGRRATEGISSQLEKIFKYFNG